MTACLPFEKRLTIFRMPPNLRKVRGVGTTVVE